MPSSRSYMEFISDQLSGLDGVAWRAMMGEYILYYRGKIVGGILPIVSRQNALYLNREISGISVDEKTIALYEGADRARGEELAVEISTGMARRMAPFVDGYYLITPFSRTALIVRIMEEIRRDMLS